MKVKLIMTKNDDKTRDNGIMKNGTVDLGDDTTSVTKNKGTNCLQVIYGDLGTTEWNYTRKKNYSQNKRALR